MTDSQEKIFRLSPDTGGLSVEPAISWRGSLGV